MKSENSASTSDLDIACQRVGRFMHDFAEVEREINEVIIDILALKGNAAGLLHSIDFFKRLNMLRTIILDLAPAVKHPELEKLFKSIIRENDNRTIMAHCPFQAAVPDAVQFRQTKARDGKITDYDPLWTSQMFAQSSENLGNIRNKLRHLRPMHDIGLGEDGVTIRRRGQYLYHSEELTPWSHMGAGSRRDR